MKNNLNLGALSKREDVFGAAARLLKSQPTTTYVAGFAIVILILVTLIVTATMLAHVEREFFGDASEYGFIMSYIDYAVFSGGLISYLSGSLLLSVAGLVHPRLVGEGADESRVMLEAAVFAERTDVSEEIVRIKSHINLFRDYLGCSEPVGKRLDFLCQEIFRETNTIASKSTDAPISQIVVEMKNELEKIREQVQNIE